MNPFFSLVTLFTSIVPSLIPEREMLASRIIKGRDTNSIRNWRFGCKLQGLFPFFIPERSHKRVGGVSKSPQRWQPEPSCHFHQRKKIKNIYLSLAYNTVESFNILPSKVPRDIPNTRIEFLGLE